MFREARLAMMPFAIVLSTMPAAATEPQLAGKYYFSSFGNPGRLHCAIVSADMATRLKSSLFACENTKTETSGPAVICTAKDNKSGYTILPTAKLCESERKNEATAE